MDLNNNELQVTYDSQVYTLTYNAQSGFYEIELQAPNDGGIYPIELVFQDLLGDEYTADSVVQVLEKEPIKFGQNKTFMWIFSHYDMSVIDILEIADYSIVVDEETNATSTIKVLKETTAVADDIVAFKKDNEVLYWGKIEEINNNNGEIAYTYTLKYLTNMFSQELALEENVTSIEEGYYRFKAVIDSNSNIAVRNGSLEDQAVVQVWEKNNLENGVWQVIKNGSHYKIKNVNSGLYLDVTGGAYTTRGTALCQSTNGCDWDFIQEETGIYYLSISGVTFDGLPMVVDIDNGVMANGTKIQNWNNVTTNQINRRFYLEKTTEPLIWEVGIEDFIANEIDRSFINNPDTFVNKDYLEIEVLTHTPIDTSVSNVEDGIYNLHTYMTNCTQYYNIVYSFSIDTTGVTPKLKITIENKSNAKQIVDSNAMNVPEYTEVFQTDITSKVIVLTSSKTYTLFLKTDRTTTTDPTDPDRAEGKTAVEYTENYEDAEQTALDIIKGNRYNHNISFSYDQYIEMGTPIAIKTKNQTIEDTYISNVTITPSKFYKYQCGNIRMNFIEKLLKEKR